MIVLVTGGRDYKDRKELFSVLDKLHAEYQFTFLIHGAATGADTLAGDWAYARGVQPVAMRALWDFDGKKKAGPLRNKRMYDFGKPQKIVAFSGGRGTANMMRIGYDAMRAGDAVEIIDVEELQ